MSKIFWGNGSQTDLMTPESVRPPIEDALTKAKESGEFDGPKGDPGDTPVKGKDYFTDEEIQEVAELAASMAGGGAGGGKPLRYTRVNATVSSGGSLTIPLSDIYADEVGGTVNVFATYGAPVLAFSFTAPPPLTILGALNAGMQLRTEINNFVALLAKTAGSEHATFSFTGVNALTILGYSSYVQGGGASDGASDGASGGAVWIDLEPAEFGSVYDVYDYFIPAENFPADKCCRITIPIEWGSFSNLVFTPRGGKTWGETVANGEVYADSFTDGGGSAVVTATYDGKNLCLHLEGDTGGMITGFYYEVL